MPPKNSIKQYRENSYYHIYNRGVEKRKIFQHKQDYYVFLSYLKIYLSPPHLQGVSLKTPPSHFLKNYTNQINLLSYCLMPNHIYLLIKQKDSISINHFMRSLGTKYSMYFNSKYKRVGPLFQGTYKAVLIEKEEQLIYLTKYIHRNPLEINPQKPLSNYPYSSYPTYLGKNTTPWVNSQIILDYFSNQNPLLSYQSFVEETPDYPDITHLTLE
jgi:putative transposase